MSSHDMPTFAALWDETLAKGLNQIKLPDKAPLVNSPTRATADLNYQAQKKINKGQSRAKIFGQLLASTKRSAARVIPPPKPATPAPAPPTGAAPSAGGAVATSPNSGSGGSGYSGNVNPILGQAANPGFATAVTKRPQA